MVGAYLVLGEIIRRAEQKKKNEGELQASSRGERQKESLLEG